jgi:hypothetical protein
MVNSKIDQRSILSRPSMYGLSAGGITTDPSFCWQFSRIATSVRPTASPEPLSVWTSSALPDPLARNLMFARRAWNASVLLHDEISR